MLFVGILICLTILGYFSFKLIRTTRIYSYIRSATFPTIVYKKNFSIGIFVGASHTSFNPLVNFENPVLTAEDVADVPAVFVADPFILSNGSAMFMFFEVFNAKSRKGEIGLARSNDWFNWKYDQIVLSEPFHLSYPYVFEWENNIYMMPESCEAEEVRLYKADDFPNKWTYLKTLKKGKYLDSSIFYYKQVWWMFMSIGDDTLYLFFADNLMGTWQEHPMNPIISRDPHVARPGGRVLVLDGKVIRFAQDDYPKYGLKVHGFEITELSKEVYSEKLVVDSLLKPSGIGWNARGMHHICPCQIVENQWIASVDGWSQRVKAFRKKRSFKWSEV